MRCFYILHNKPGSNWWFPTNNRKISTIYYGLNCSIRLKVKRRYE